MNDTTKRGTWVVRGEERDGTEIVRVTLQNVTEEEADLAAAALASKLHCYAWSGRAELPE